MLDGDWSSDVCSSDLTAGRSVAVTVLVGTILASPSLAAFVIGRIAPASWSADRTVAATNTAATDTDAASGAPTGAAAEAPCMTLSNYAALAALPRGLVAAEINIGPSILAATSHAVVSAPYHRMQRGILDGDRMLRSRPEVAISAMEARGVDYVALCVGSKSAESARTDEPDSLLVALMNGRPPARLEPVVTDGPVRVFRLPRKDSLADLRGGLTFH
jgi:hypothetical protein